MGATKRYGLDWGNPEYALQELDALLTGGWGPNLKAVVVATRTFAYFGGPVFNRVTGVTSLVANGTIVCPDNSTVVVQHDYAGTVSTASTLLAFNLPMAIVICAGGVMTHFKDIRDAAFDRRGLLPPGGNEGDLAVKATDNDYEVTWRDFASVQAIAAAAAAAPPGAKGMFRVESLVGTSDGADITAWTDDTGNGNMPDPGAGVRPSYHLDPLNDGDGVPAVHFDGVDEYMRRTGMTSPANTDLIVFLVASHPGTAGVLWELQSASAFGGGGSAGGLVTTNGDNMAVRANNVGGATARSGGCAATDDGDTGTAGKYVRRVYCFQWCTRAGQWVLIAYVGHTAVAHILTAAPPADFTYTALIFGASGNGGGAPVSFGELYLSFFSYYSTTKLSQVEIATEMTRLRAVYKAM